MARRGAWSCRKRSASEVGRIERGPAVPAHSAFSFGLAETWATGGLWVEVVRIQMLLFGAQATFVSQRPAGHASVEPIVLHGVRDSAQCAFQ